MFKQQTPFQLSRRPTARLSRHRPIRLDSFGVDVMLPPAWLTGSPCPSRNGRLLQHCEKGGRWIRKVSADTNAVASRGRCPWPFPSGGNWRPWRSCACAEGSKLNSCEFSYVNVAVRRGMPPQIRPALARSRGLPLHGSHSRGREPRERRSTRRSKAKRRTSRPTMSVGVRQMNVNLQSRDGRSRPHGNAYHPCRGATTDRWLHAPGVDRSNRHNRKNGVDNAHLWDWLLKSRRFSLPCTYDKPI